MILVLVYHRARVVRSWQHGHQSYHAPGLLLGKAWHGDHASRDTCSRIYHGSANIVTEPCSLFVACSVHLVAHDRRQDHSEQQFSHEDHDLTTPTISESIGVLLSCSYLPYSSINTEKCRGRVFPLLGWEHPPASRISWCGSRTLFSFRPADPSTCTVPFAASHNFTGFFSMLYVSVLRIDT